LKRRLAAANKRAKQATSLVRLARKRGRSAKRVQFAQGVQAERAISKTAQKEKRSSKNARKGQEGVRRRKEAARRRAENVPHVYQPQSRTWLRHDHVPVRQHRTWHAQGWQPTPPQQQQRQPWPQQRPQQQWQQQQQWRPQQPPVAPAQPPQPPPPQQQRPSPQQPRPPPQPEPPPLPPRQPPPPPRRPPQPPPQPRRPSPQPKQQPPPQLRQPPRQQGAPPQQRQEPPPSRPGIPVGTARKLAGLASRPELNGLSCIVQGYDTGSGRYCVEYEAAGVRAMISVQPGKLGAAMPPPPPRAPKSQRERLDAHKHGRR